MNRSILLTVAAVIAIIYGLALVISPTFVNDMHGMASSASTDVLGRGYGAALLALGITAWFARNAPLSETLSGFMRGAFVYTVIAAVALVVGVTGGALNAAGWVPAAINVLLAIGFGYYGFVDKAKA